MLTLKNLNPVILGGDPHPEPEGIEWLPLFSSGALPKSSDKLSVLFKGL